MRTENVWLADMGGTDGIVRGPQISHLVTGEIVEVAVVARMEELVTASRELAFQKWLIGLVEELDDLFEDQRVYLKHFSDGATCLVFERSDLPEFVVGLPGEDGR